MRIVVVAVLAFSTFAACKGADRAAPEAPAKPEATRAPRNTFAQLDIEPVALKDGALEPDMALVDLVLADQRAAFADCAARAWRARPPRDSRLTFELSVGMDGRPDGLPKLLSPSLSREFDTCAGTILGGLRFPATGDAYRFNGALVVAPAG